MSDLGEAFDRTIATGVKAMKRAVRDKARDRFVCSKCFDDGTRRHHAGCLYRSSPTAPRREEQIAAATARGRGSVVPGHTPAEWYQRALVRADWQISRALLGKTLTIP